MKNASTYSYRISLFITFITINVAEYGQLYDEIPTYSEVSNIIIGFVFFSVCIFGFCSIFFTLNFKCWNLTYSFVGKGRFKASNLNDTFLQKQ